MLFCDGPLRLLEYFFKYTYYFAIESGHNEVYYRFSVKNLFKCLQEVKTGGWTVQTLGNGNN